MNLELKTSTHPWQCCGSCASGMPISIHSNKVFCHKIEQENKETDICDNGYERSPYVCKFCGSPDTRHHGMDQDGVHKRMQCKKCHRHYKGDKA